MAQNKKIEIKTWKDVANLSAGDKLPKSEILKILRSNQKLVFTGAGKLREQSLE